MIFTEKQFKKALSEVIYGGEKANERFNELKNEIERLKVEKKDLDILFQKEKERLKSEIASLESKRKLEEEEIKHLVKMKEEKLLLDTSRKDVELQKKFTEREMELQREYHGKVLKTIEDSRQESKEFYNKIMDRLPNVNLEIKRRQ